MKEDYDMVIVSRYLDGAKSEDDDVITAFGNWLFTKTVNFLRGGHYTDAMVIYRAFKKQVVHDLDLMNENAYRLAEKVGRRILLPVHSQVVRLALAQANPWLLLYHSAGLPLHDHQPHAL